ncbi:hypothetical protein ACWCQQ_17165 [Streptomyces sp. NPDC002143]
MSVGAAHQADGPVSGPVLRSPDPSRPPESGGLQRPRHAPPHPSAVHALRQAATAIGEVAAILVLVHNPRTLVLGGPLSDLRDDLLSGVRAVVYQRALPLTTRKLTITTARPDGASAIHGGIALALRDVFSEQGIARMLVDDRKG